MRFRRRAAKHAAWTNASDADLKQLVEDPEDAPVVEAAAETSDEKAAPPTSP
jgi:hypothetical protein